MNRGIRNIGMVVGTLAALALAGPASAEEQDMPMMKQGHSGMMGGGMGGQGHMSGMMGQGQGMMGGGMMGPGMMSGGMGMMGPGPMARLDLDRNQVEQMNEIHKEMASKCADRMGDMRLRRWELSQELAKDEPSAQKVGKLFLQVRKNRQQFMQERKEGMQQMMQNLSEEQREQMQERMQNMRQMRMGGDSGSGNMPMHNR
ncbi:Spy/CpxP family protein refolding chaperone [Thiohalorhabdus sp.]|uniref:Spy/CpxP family protein refolding chaperone n=1 Tax=Thiohalorhabdus sp. TaxID=3094134 RepID=UPI002FC284B6